MAEPLDLSGTDPDDLSLVLGLASREVPVGTEVVLSGLRRHRSALGAPTLEALMSGAGWRIDSASPGSQHDEATARTYLTLPDRLTTGLKIVIVGINPSPAAAETGVAFARAGNRFWPAAIEAGLVSADRDPASALENHSVGFTDVVNRTTAAASELTSEEIRAGFADLELKMAWARPALVVLMGISVWKTYREPRARLGPSGERLGEQPVWVAPNPSGRNAHVTLADLVDHFHRILSAVE